MSVARSCSQCRRSKVKCDRLRPTCSRCNRLGLQCVGYQTEDRFFCENETARRNSQRARGDRGQPAFDSHQPLHLVSSTASSEQGSFWLKQNVRPILPEPLKRDIDTRAVDRFFVNWVLNPGRDGISPGHMYRLPLQYHRSSPDSMLWHAVRAMAFADIKNARSRDGVPFHIQARRSYGQALTRIRKAAQSEEDISSADVLTALLLVDSFESMYLSQTEPLGPHITAIMFILNARGKELLYDESEFALFRAANCRLQSRQIWRGEEPEPVQEALLSELDPGRPEVRITLDITRMSHLCAEAKKVLESVDLFESAEPFVRNLDQSINRIQNLIGAMTTWTSTTTGIWKPSIIHVSAMLAPEARVYSADHPLANFHSPTLLSYSDVWFAYIWNFHTASQIVLREALIRLVNCRAGGNKSQLASQDELDLVRKERCAIERLGASIIDSFPPLMGFIDESGAPPLSVPHGLMAGRFLALFAMDVVRNTEYTLQEHKITASAVVEWIHAQHALD